MELSVEEESMAFTAATFIVRYSPQLFNTPSDIRQQSDIIAEIVYSNQRTDVFPPYIFTTE
jgi:hypothetical protein